MAKHPILFFPRRTETARERPKGFPPGSPHIPSSHSQTRRLSPKFDELHRVFNAHRAEISMNASGASPEHVIVLETIGAIDNFLNACRNIDGLEWLADIDEDAIEPDDDFYDEKNKDKLLTGRLFLSMANQQAMQTLLILWKRYSTNPNSDLGYGRNSWKDIFKHLYDIRKWDVKDRVKETFFLEDLQLRIDNNENNIPFEIELWYRGDISSRELAETQLRHLIEQEGGSIVTSSIINEIRYHALLADVPANTAKYLLNNLEDVKLIKCDQVMFFRPVGQSVSISPILESQAIDILDLEDKPLPPKKEPIVALLDGLPMVGHKFLEGRLIIDDPWGWSDSYTVADCRHGTMMASLILHDEINTLAPPIDRPLYVRPIMKPRINLLKGINEEYIPEDVLLTDLIHISVKRLFEGEGEESPVGPSIRVINLSIGDPTRPFLRYLSSLARLLDWLSHKYNVLFCVSAGNHLQSLEIPSDTEFEHGDLEGKALAAIESDIRNRRLLSPAESINALTVGALHHDASGDYPSDRRIDLHSKAGLASPISARGLGFNRSVKPDILFPGGRQLYRTPLIGSSYKIADIDKAPGQLTACPGDTRDHATYTRGTSNAAALASRGAHKCYNVLENLANFYGIDDIDAKHIPPLLKAMIIHSARWDKDAIEALGVLKNNNNSRIFKSVISKHIGYGCANIEKVLTCTEERATVLGYGELEGDKAHIYKLPLPIALSGKTFWRSLAITLAWTSPINVNHRKYRQAHLSFSPPLKELGVQRDGADWRAVQRGTVQHEVMSGKKALDYLEGEELLIQIDCRADATNKLADPIPYALAVTLEVEEGVPVPVYQEIKQKLGISVTIKPRA